MAQLDAGATAAHRGRAARVGRHIYVIGGFERSTGSTTAATERYDTRRDRWTRVEDMPRPLNHVAATSYRGDVYVVGGYAGESGLTNEVATLYRYDPQRDRWRRLPSMPTARGALTAGVIGDRLYAAGGASTHHAGALPTLEVFDLRTRRWRSRPDMPTAREHLGGAVSRGRLYTFAGRVNGLNNLAVVESFDPRARRWRSEPEMRKPRSGIGAAPTRGRIVVAGGEEDGGHDPRGRALRPAHAPLAPARRPADAAPRARRRRPPRARLRARRRRPAGLRVHGHRRGAQDRSLSRAVQISSTGQRCAHSTVIHS